MTNKEEMLAAFVSPGSIVVSGFVQKDEMRPSGDLSSHCWRSLSIFDEDIRGLLLIDVL